MTRTARIKICGITNKEDAEKLAKLDVDALGFIVTKREFPHRISAEDAKEIISHLPPFITSVLAEAYLSLEDLVSLCKELKPNALQIQHGLDQPNELKKLKKSLPEIKIIKAVRTDLENPNEADVRAKAKEVAKVVDAILLDGIRRKYKKLELKEYWEIAQKVVKEVPKPVILAGKLNIENVAEVIKVVKPYGVDLISGVETAPGKKDFRKVREFIKAVRGADLED